MKKQIPSKKARETCSSFVNFKNQCFRYLHHCVKKITVEVTKIFVPGAAHSEFVQELLTDIISTKENKGNTTKISNLKGKWDRLTNII